MTPYRRGYDCHIFPLYHTHLIRSKASTGLFRTIKISRKAVLKPFRDLPLSLALMIVDPAVNDRKPNRGG
tara:strand:- start:27970 stop:28179 length:210 start_codon:yes stop_codon:yes gene_type:complete